MSDDSGPSNRQKRIAKRNARHQLPATPHPIRFYSKPAKEVEKRVKDAVKRERASEKKQPWRPRTAANRAINDRQLAPSWWNFIPRMWQADGARWTTTHRSRAWIEPPGARLSSLRDDFSRSDSGERKSAITYKGIEGFYNTEALIDQLVTIGQYQLDNWDVAKGIPTQYQRNFADKQWWMRQFDHTYLYAAQACLPLADSDVDPSEPNAATNEARQIEIGMKTFPPIMKSRDVVKTPKGMTQRSTHRLPPQQKRLISQFYTNAVRVQCYLQAQDAAERRGQSAMATIDALPADKQPAARSEHENTQAKRLNDIWAGSIYDSELVLNQIHGAIPIGTAGAIGESPAGAIEDSIFKDENRGATGYFSASDGAKSTAIHEHLRVSPTGNLRVTSRVQEAVKDLNAVPPCVARYVVPAAGTQIDLPKGEMKEHWGWNDLLDAPVMQLSLDLVDNPARLLEPDGGQYALELVRRHDRTFAALQGSESLENSWATMTEAARAVAWRGGAIYNQFANEYGDFHRVSQLNPRSDQTVALDDSVAANRVLVLEQQVVAKGEDGTIATKRLSLGNGESKGELRPRLAVRPGSRPDYLVDPQTKEPLMQVELRLGNSDPYFMSRVILEVMAGRKSLQTMSYLKAVRNTFARQLRDHRDAVESASAEAAERIAGVRQEAEGEVLANFDVKEFVRAHIFSAIEAMRHDRQALALALEDAGFPKDLAQAETISDETLQQVARANSDQLVASANAAAKEALKAEVHQAMEDYERVERQQLEKEGIRIPNKPGFPEIFANLPLGDSPSERAVALKAVWTDLTTRVQAAIDTPSPLFPGQDVRLAKRPTQRLLQECAQVIDTSVAALQRDERSQGTGGFSYIFSRYLSGSIEPILPAMQDGASSFDGVRATKTCAFVTAQLNSTETQDPFGSEILKQATAAHEIAEAQGQAILLALPPNQRQNDAKLLDSGLPNGFPTMGYKAKPAGRDAAEMRSYLTREGIVAVDEPMTLNPNMIKDISQRGLRMGGSATELAVALQGYKDMKDHVASWEAVAASMNLVFFDTSERSGTLEVVRSMAGYRKPGAATSYDGKPLPGSPRPQHQPVAVPGTGGRLHFGTSRMEVGRDLSNDRLLNDNTPPEQRALDPWSVQELLIPHSPFGTRGGPRVDGTIAPPQPGHLDHNSIFPPAWFALSGSRPISRQQREQAGRLSEAGILNQGRLVLVTGHQLVGPKIPSYTPPEYDPTPGTGDEFNTQYRPGLDGYGTFVPEPTPTWSQRLGLAHSPDHGAIAASINRGLRTLGLSKTPTDVAYARKRLGQPLVDRVVSTPDGRTAWSTTPGHPSSGRQVLNNLKELSAGASDTRLALPAADGQVPTITLRTRDLDPKPERKQIDAGLSDAELAEVERAQLPPEPAAPPAPQLPPPTNHKDFLDMDVVSSGADLEAVEPCSNEPNIPENIDAMNADKNQLDQQGGIEF
jgi:hypothetical protein